MAAQFVNFVIVFFAIYRFALKPLLKTMTERSATIAKSLNQAKQIETEVARTSQESAKQIAQAKREAVEIIAEASKKAEFKRQEILDQTEQKVAQVVAQAKEQIQSEKEVMMSEIKAEAAELIMQATARVLKTKVDSAVDKKLISQSLKEWK